MQNPFEIDENRYQPNSNFASKLVDNQLLALWVGYVALGLPIVMLLSTFIFHVCALDSLSHFYYTKITGDVFVGSLVFIGVFMIVYRGETPEENFLATVAGTASFGIALFPTTKNGCEGEPFSGRVFTDNNGAVVDALIYQLFPSVEILHYISAFIVFGFLAFFTFFVFTRVDQSRHMNEDGKLIPTKAKRNKFYIFSGVLIVLSIIALSLQFVIDFENWNKLNLTFIFEAIALLAFGASWMVKGRSRLFNWLGIYDPK